MDETEIFDEFADRILTTTKSYGTVCVHEIGLQATIKQFAELICIAQDILECSHLMPENKHRLLLSLISRIRPYGLYYIPNEWVGELTFHQKYLLIICASPDCSNLYDNICEFLQSIEPSKRRGFMHELRTLNLGINRRIHNMYYGAFDALVLEDTDVFIVVKEIFEKLWVFIKHEQ